MDTDLSFNSISTMLKAMELAGGGSDATFPLAERWELCGKFIFEILAGFDVVPESGINLLRNVARLMRGVSGDGSGNGGPGIVTGQNGRARGYSVSESSFIFPLPASMVAGYVKALNVETNQSVRNEVIAVMKKASWADNIFVQLDKETRQTIAKKLLSLSLDNVDNAAKGFNGLTLNCGEVTNLIEMVDLTDKDYDDQLLMLTILSTYISLSSKTLVSESVEGSYTITKLLFNKLAQLRSHSGGGIDYVLDVLLSTLLALTSSFPKISTEATLSSTTPSKKSRRKSSDLNSKNSGTKEKSDFAAYAQLLVNLLGGSDSSSVLTSSTCTQSALALLTVLCGLSPATVASSLLPALQVITTNSEKVDDATSFQITNDSLMAIVPAYCMNAKAAGLTLMDLLKNFVDYYNEIGPHRRSGVFGSLMNALIRVEKCVAVGSLAASLLAVHAKAGGEGDHGQSFCLNLIQRAPTSEQVRMN